MIKNMKSLLKFLGVLLVLFVWVELINLSFYLMDLPDTILFYTGVLTLGLWIMGPIFYYGSNIRMFLRNMKGVFTEEKKSEK